MRGPLQEGAEVQRSLLRWRQKGVNGGQALKWQCENAFVLCDKACRLHRYGIPVQGQNNTAAEVFIAFFLPL